ncbi:MAG: hypothetical protein BGN97_12475 [Microbacterium sp. 69-10]|uniref:substrate-binding domain-containing protein n=1 Tax=Microbacterium sp. 69-10 TaxID=1895783 RepID=UPI0009604E7D|nr:substrate-binding domain-containing protein [Microbacterium sp. 69-10]OJU38985.1 MAG: hypothetical protein BGN97_12475 [Microbacterium sp. 69-10]
MVGEHLWETHRRRIAFAGGPFAIRQVADRFTGLQEALAQHGSSSVEVLDCPNRSIDDGIRIGGMLAERDAQHRPDAVFAVNDMIALGLMRSLIDGGMRVPQDIAVVGYDDAPVAAASIIPLSSVRATSSAHGQAAFDLLLTSIENRTEAQHLVFQPTLHARASSASADGS